MSTVPDMLFEFGGAPVSGGRYSSPFNTHYFVDGNSGYGNDTNDGKKPTSAKATIQAAVTAASHGDVIYVRPLTYIIGTGMGRYDENVTVPVATTNLSIIGAIYPIGNNTDGLPRIRRVDASYPLVVDGAALRLENMGFFAATLSTGPAQFRMSTPTYLGSNYFVIYNCSFRGIGNVDIQGGTSWRIYNSIFELSTGTLQLGSPSSSVYKGIVQGCHFLDNNGAAVTGPYISTSGANCYSLIIKDCTFSIIPSGAKFIVFDGNNSTGMLVNCFFNDPDVHITTDITMGTTFRMVGCHDGSGALVV